ncbi:DUF7935 family protein [Myroides sp. LJL119]
MTFSLIPQLIAYTLPGLILAGISGIYFNKIIRSQNKANKYLIDNLNTSEFQTTPLKIQALERLTILVERIDLENLLLRITPIGQDKLSFETLLIQHINQEFDFNISQQIYVSDKLWSIISQTKQTLIQTIQQTSSIESLDNAQDLQRALITQASSLKQNTTICIESIKAQAQQYL